MAGEVETIIEERSEENMVSCCNGEKPTSVIRIAKFIRPNTTTDFEAAVAQMTLLSESIKHCTKTVQSYVGFKGWRNPQKNWGEWIHRLLPIHANMWKQLGIHDSIMSSKYKINYDRELVMGICQYWCPLTNTFIFPWGEATISLEDVLILGGFSLLGESVRTPLSIELLHIEKKLSAEHTALSKTKSKRASYSEWMSRFRDCKCNISELEEHIAFLVLWLSRFVFPSHPEETVGKHVFPIAIHLAHGKAIALGPAVLAAIYTDLKLLKEYLAEKPVSVWAPMQLVQMWAWEHFLPMKRSNPVPLAVKDPRAARWHNNKSNSKAASVLSCLKLEQNFQWRPYTASVTNWRLPAFYKEKDELCYHNQEEERELLSFPRCLRPCVLVGLGLANKEKYLPHRFARQFGYDQDIPSYFPDFITYEIAWQKFEGRYSIKNAKSFARSLFLEASVTSNYLEWWKTFRFLSDEAASKDAEIVPFQKSVDAEMKRKSVDSSDDEEGENDQDLPLPISYYGSSPSDKTRSSKKNTKKSDSGKATAKKARANTKLRGKCTKDSGTTDFQGRLLGTLEKLVSSLAKET